MVAAPAIAEVIEQESLIPRKLQLKWSWIGVYFNFWGRPLTTHGEQSHVPELFFKYYISAILKRLPTPPYILSSLRSAICNVSNQHAVYFKLTQCSMSNDFLDLMK